MGVARISLYLPKFIFDLKKFDIIFTFLSSLSSPQILYIPLSHSCFFFINGSSREGFIS